MIVGNEGSLPKNWRLSLISECAEINPTINKAEIPDDLEVSFIPMASVQAENGNIDASGVRKFSEVKKGYTPFVEGDVLFAKITPCMENGKMAVAPVLKNNIGFGSTEFHVLRCSTGISSHYLYYYVSSKSFRKLAEHYMTGAVGQKRVTAPYLSNCKIPIPPTNEQHRIVAKIEALFSELDKGIESFKTAREQLKIYRQALLKHAFSGKLTEQWRAENKGKLESAETLLQSIQAERQHRYRQQIKDWEQSKSPPAPLFQRGEQAASQPACLDANTIPPFEKGGLGGILKPKAPKALPPLTAEELAELPELPEGWVWSRLEELSQNVTDGDHQAPPQTMSGIPFITISDIKNQKIDFTETRYVSSEYFNSLSESRKPVIGDILYTVTGSFGIPCLIDFDREFCFQRHIGLIRPLRNISTKYLFYCLASQHIYSQAVAVATGTAQKTVPLGGLRLFKIPLAPIEEQNKIVLELEKGLSEIDQLDQTLTTALQQAEALRQSILKKAFSGQLVPQDPNDEPASVLLERIYAERVQCNKSPRNAVKRKKT